MKQILLLTKNIFVEAEWQNRIQQLGYEVFCSTQLLEKILQKRDYMIFGLFKTVIFSESVTNEEVAKVVQTNTSNNVSFFRIDEQALPSEVNTGDKTQETVIVLNSQMTLNELRENLCNKNSIKILTTVLSNPNSSDQFEGIPVHLIATLVSTMSKKEKELFHLLYEKHGDFVSRVELSETIWRQEVSNSSLTQLSQIVRRLKAKMKKIGLDEELIETHWNKGYALSKVFCENIDIYMGEKIF
ncbi:winged helix-turn-helix domain-containing protein [Enterococcus sp. HY326]|uniref:winged helix-turn-helix domain-containing protein n=1 Tax=Enterococcus sp. HY326 TaxID=2971265 RepID=UPI00223EEC9D|nr:helix-turn-helix domain-containing protein [Enterococcus sp. HY326]